MANLLYENITRIVSGIVVAASQSVIQQINDKIDQNQATLSATLSVKLDDIKSVQDQIVAELRGEDGLDPSQLQTISDKIQAGTDALSKAILDDTPTPMSIPTSTPNPPEPSIADSHAV